MPSRFRICQKKQIAHHGNSSSQTQPWQEEGLFPAAVSFCFGLAVTLRRIKSCFVAAVSSPLLAQPLCILCTVQHAEGEIKVKATSVGRRYSGTLHAHAMDTQTRAQAHADCLALCRRVKTQTGKHIFTCWCALCSVGVAQWWMSRQANHTEGH